MRIANNRRIKVFVVVQKSSRHIKITRGSNITHRRSPSTATNHMGVLARLPPCEKSDICGVPQAPFPQLSHKPTRYLRGYKQKSARHFCQKSGRVIACQSDPRKRGVNRSKSANAKSKKSGHSNPLEFHLFRVRFVLIENCLPVSSRRAKYRYGSSHTRIALGTTSWVAGKL
jgi:hypothetical protein